MKATQKTGKMVLCAFMMCLIIVLTMLIRIPIPFTQGYVHLGDMAVFLSVMLLGWKKGAVCAGLGSAMADILCGMVIWAPWTFVIKGIMALIMGVILEKRSECIIRSREIVALVLASSWMVGGYFIAEWIVYGTWQVAVLGIPWNIGQAAVGACLMTVLNKCLCKTSAKSMFSYTVKTA